MDAAEKKTKYLSMLEKLTFQERKMESKQNNYMWGSNKYYEEK